MGIKFDKAAFTAGFNQGATGVREMLSEERKIKAEALKNANQATQALNTSVRSFAMKDIESREKFNLDIAKVTNDDDYNALVDAYNENIKKKEKFLNDNMASYTPDVAKVVSSLDFTPKGRIQSYTLPTADGKGTETINLQEGIPDDVLKNAFIDDAGAIRQYRMKTTGEVDKTQSYEVPELKQVRLSREDATSVTDASLNQSQYSEAVKNGYKGSYQKWKSEQKASDAKGNKTYRISELPDAERKIWTEHGFGNNDEITQTQRQQGTSSMFKDGGKGNKKTIGDIKVTQYESYEKSGGKLSFEAWETKIQEETKLKSEAKITADAIHYGHSLNSDSYNADEALLQESIFIGTKANNSKIQARADEFEQKIVLEKSSTNLYNEFKKDVDSGLYKSGILKTTAKKIIEYSGEGKFSELLGLSGDEMASRLGLDTKMGDSVAKYVKLISGAAATDAERSTLMNIMFGSEFQDEKARLKKFGSFLEKMRSDNTTEAKSIKKYRPHSAGEYLYGGSKTEKKPSKSIRLDKSELDKILAEQYGAR